MSIQSCAGGWCTKRDHCANYHAASPDQTPAERLCPPGQDGAGLQFLADQEIELTVTRATRQRVLAVITDAGKSIAELSTEAGVHPTNARGAVRLLSEEGQAFTCGRNIEGTKHHFLLVFKTAAARDAERAKLDIVARQKQRLAHVAYLARVRRASDPERAARIAARKQRAEEKRAAAEAKKLEAERRAAGKAMRAAEAELRKQRARLDREAKAAEKQRAKAEAKKTQNRLKAETKKAGALVFKGGTTVAKPKKLTFAELPAVNPNGVKPVEIPSKLRDRFAPDKNAPSVISSRECRGWAQAVAA